MFDDKQNLNSQSSAQGGGVPPNLPVSNSSAPASQTAPTSSEPEDILSDVEVSSPEPAPLANNPQSFGSKVNLGPKSSEVPPAMSASQSSVSKEPVFGGKKKIVVVIIVIVILAVLSAAAWYGYQVFTGSQSSVPSVNNNVPAVNNNQPSGNQNANAINQNSNTNTNTNNVNTNANAGGPADPTPAPVDTDRDGLNDEEEALYGTDPLVVDTDEDGLTDRDEVRVFETDPNNPDSDGDGFTDGGEVRAGYDPKGPGKLLEIN